MNPIATTLTNQLLFPEHRDVTWVWSVTVNDPGITALFHRMIPSSNTRMNSVAYEPHADLKCPYICYPHLKIKK